MNTLVSFKLAKLLKEKGFDVPCREGWVNYLQSFTGEMGMPKSESNLVLDRLGNSHLIEQPTIAVVVMWLYEKHDIWILVDWMKRTKPYNSGFYSHLRGTNKTLNQDNFISINNTKSPGYEVFNTPTEAYEAAIKYTLTKLIK